MIRTIIKPKMYKRSVSSWNRWFAWRPVHVRGQWQWLQYVYRYPILKTYETINLPTRYEYGDIFDVLRDEQKRIL